MNTTTQVYELHNDLVVFPYMVLWYLYTERLTTKIPINATTHEKSMKWIRYLSEMYFFVSNLIRLIDFFVCYFVLHMDGTTNKKEGFNIPCWIGNFITSIRCTVLLKCVKKNLKKTNMKTHYAQTILNRGFPWAKTRLYLKFHENISNTAAWIQEYIGRHQAARRTDMHKSIKKSESILLRTIAQTEHATVPQAM